MHCWITLIWDHGFKLHLGHEFLLTYNRVVIWCWTTLPTLLTRPALLLFIRRAMFSKIYSNTGEKTRFELLCQQEWGTDEQSQHAGLCSPRHSINDDRKMIAQWHIILRPRCIVLARGKTTRELFSVHISRKCISCVFLDEQTRSSATMDGVYWRVHAATSPTP
jgi:hypothetical protein